MRRNTASPVRLQTGTLHSSEGLLVYWDLFTSADHFGSVIALIPFWRVCARDGSCQSSIWTQTLFGKKSRRKADVCWQEGVQTEELMLGAYAGWHAAFLTLIWVKLALCEQFELPRLHAGWEQDAINGAPAPHRWGCKRIHAEGQE